MIGRSPYDKRSPAWTDERVNLLRELHGRGLSAGKIASELSCGITRNAVIGKLSRLGLRLDSRLKPVVPKEQAPVRAPRAPRTAKPAPSPLPKVPPLRSFNARPAEARPGKDDISDEKRALLAQRANAPAPGSIGVTIMELNASMCRWPMGDPVSPDFRYCGADAPIGDGPYCRHHNGIAYTAARPRKPMSDAQREAVRRGIRKSSLGRR